MKICVTILLFAVITVTIVEAQAHTRSRPSGGKGNTQRNTVRTAPKNFSRNRQPARPVSVRKPSWVSQNKVNHQRNNKPKAIVGIKGSKSNGKVTAQVKPPVMKPAAPVKKPIVKTNVNKIAVNSVANRQKINKPNNIQNVKNNGNIKVGVKPVAGKPAPTTQVKKEVLSSNGIHINNKPNQQKINKQENVENTKNNVNVKPEIKTIDGKLASTAQVKTDAKNGGNVHAEVKLVNGVPKITAGGRKEVYSNKGASVAVTGDITAQQNNNPTLSLGIEGTKNGNNTNADMKIVDGNVALGLKGAKDIYSNKDTKVSLNSGAILLKSDKSKVSFGIDGTKNSDSANARFEVDDGNSLLDLGFTKQIYKNKDTQVTLNGGTTLHKGNKPETFFGIDAKRNGDSANAQLRTSNGKSAVDFGVAKEIYSNKDTNVLLKADATLQKGDNSKLSFGVEGTKGGNNIGAEVDLIGGQTAFGVDMKNELYKKNGLDVSLKTGVHRQTGGNVEGTIGLELRKDF